MKLTEVQFQPWTTLISDFYICQHCGYVDRDPKKMGVGAPCQVCKTPSPGARVYFSHPAFGLVNSIQDFYFLRHAKPPPDADGLREQLYSNETDTRIAIPLLFCTLWDVLTTRLCQTIMRAKSIAPAEQATLLKKNRFSAQKRKLLFPELTNESWQAGLDALNKNGELNFTGHFEFFESINKKRNALIHEGRLSTFRDDELERFPAELRITFHLFAGLHNRYVHLAPVPL